MEHDYENSQSVSMEELAAISDQSIWWQQEEEAKPRIKKSAERHKFIYSIGKLSETTDSIEEIIMNHDLQFFDRGSALVRPIVSDAQSTKGEVIKAVVLSYVAPPYMKKQLSKIIDWKSLKPKKGKGKEGEFEEYSIDPPDTIVSSILSNAGDWPFHKIAGIVTAPTLRRDGSILWKEGYDQKTKLLLVNPPALPLNMPENPTKADALNAINRLNSLLDGFPFVDKPSRSVALSALITPIARSAMSVAPLHCISAPTAGTGKSYLVDLSSALISGTEAPVTSVGKTEEETEKRLSSSVMEGSPIIVLDNVNGKLYGDALCQCVERPVVKFRPLGKSEMVRVENKATIFATGNNISLIDDMNRRTIMCKLDAGIERPELKEFHLDPFAEILRNRGQYIADALNVVRAYKLAGSPNLLPKLASFEEWSDLVRSAIVWLGFEDPLKSMEVVRADDDNLADLRMFIAAWFGVAQDKPYTAKELLAKFLTDPDSESMPALKSFVKPRSNLDLDETKLGVKLRNIKGRVVDGFKVCSEFDTHKKNNHWYLESLAEVPTKIAGVRSVADDLDDDEIKF